MAIQYRRGQFTDFDPSKLKPGEPAVVLSGDPDSTDGASVYFCFNAGNVKRMATYEDMVKNIKNITDTIEQEFTQALEDAISEAESQLDEMEAATTNATNAASAANQAADAADDALAAIQGAVQGTIINDNAVSENTTYSSSKIEEEINELSSKTLPENPITHRNIYRGKSLGSTVTEAQKAAIQAGTFEDLYIGDYWTIGGVNWVIADMDYWYNTGDTAFTDHHLVIVPAKILYSAVMNDTATTSGGYVGSKMYTEGLNQAKTQIQSAFGDMVKSHREYLVNAVTNGYPSAGAWYDSTAELMNEIMVYGSYVYTPGSTGSISPTRYTTDNAQLSLFRLNPGAIKIQQSYWLRDVVSLADFADTVRQGNASFNAATYSFGVRPVFAIG